MTSNQTATAGYRDDDEGEPKFPRWDLTSAEIDSILMFPYCNKPAVTRGDALTPVDWPWLNGKASA